MTVTVREGVEIVAYRDGWRDEFTVLAARIREAFGELALRIDHIGSTSVPRLDAKDILDLQITVRDFDDEDALRAATEAAGLLWRDEIGRDHRPAWSTVPDDAWEKRYVSERDGRPVHVHVRVAGRPNQRYPLLFRDYLRTDAHAAAAYASAKRSLAGVCPDSRTYAYAKDPIADLVAIAAEHWAARVGWSPGASDA